MRGDGQTSVVYDASTGEISLDAPIGQSLTSFHLVSASGIFTGDPPLNLDGSLDGSLATQIFKVTFGGSFSDLTFGTVALPGLSRAFLLADLSAEGSIEGGGSLGSVDLVFIESAAGPDPLSDLADVGPSSITPDPAGPGQTITIRSTIENQGTADTGPFTITFTLDGQTLTYAEVVEPGLAVGHSFDFEGRCELPADLSPGTHEVGWTIKVDSDNNPSNNQAALQFNVTAATVADLHDVGESYRGFSPRTVDQGLASPFTIESRIANAGPGDAEPCVVRFYASADQQIDPNADYLLGMATLPRIEAGQSHDLKFQGPFPRNVSEGTYYVGWVIDADDQVHEGVNEGNNTAYKQDAQLEVRLADEHEDPGHWNQEKAPPAGWRIQPQNPTTNDLIYFSGPSQTFANLCEAEQALGIPIVQINQQDRTIELVFTPADARTCPGKGDPVSSISGDFGPLKAGDWRFFGNAAHAIFSIPFTVRPAPSPDQIIFVDDDAPGANNGTRWEHAFNRLQDALAASAPGKEIWVAQGLYPADLTIELTSAHVVRGGYAGHGQPDPNLRDVGSHVSTLSADLNSDDAPVTDVTQLLTEPTRADNSAHVVTITGGNETTHLSGFVITGGNSQNEVGAGLIVYGGNPTISDCAFLYNASAEGGAVFNEFSHPRFVDCMFAGNFSSTDGGAMVNFQSDAELAHCTFTDSMGGRHGGGLCNGASDPTLTYCTFRGNRAIKNGGGLFSITASNTTLIRCVFTDNEASKGGALGHRLGESSMQGCVLTRNTALDSGGALASEESRISAVNCRFSGNAADQGGPGIASDTSTILLINCTFLDNGQTVTCVGAPSTVDIANCILWNDGAEEIGNPNGSTVAVTHSIVRGGAPTYLDVNPQFADAEGRLTEDSPCIDAGDNAAITAAMDLDGRERIAVIPITISCFADYAKNGDFQGQRRRSSRVVRGGSWNNNGTNCTVSNRNNNNPNNTNNIGFRVCR